MPSNESASKTTANTAPPGTSASLSRENKGTVSDVTLYKMKGGSQQLIASPTFIIKQTVPVQSWSD